MSTTDRFCVDCRAFRAADSTCAKGERLDHVVGKTYRPCASMRTTSECGPEGAQWEPTFRYRLARWLAALFNPETKQ